MSQRDAINRLVEANHVAPAASALGDLWRSDPSLRTAAFVVSTFEKIRGGLRLLPYRVAIARSFTVEPLIPILRADAFVSGMDLAIHLGGFNAYAQELVDPHSALYQFAPDVVFLAVQTQDVAPDLWRDYARMTADAREGAARRLLAEVRDLTQAVRSHSRANLVLHTFEVPPQPCAGVLDSQSVRGQIPTIQRINADLRALAEECLGVYVLDYDALVAAHGRLQWHDRAKWAAAAVPIAADHLIHLARGWMRILHPLTGRVAKVLAVDLDRTLWGGVVGEDGFDGIQIGPEFPGAVHQSLQRTLLDLRERGILLAVCSKNNADEAMAVLDRHPGMLVRPEHFSAIRINWEDKSTNLRSIASELNVGLDAIAFADDDPVEQALVRQQLPEAIVIPLPEDSLEYASALASHPAFERLVLSDEDRTRTTHYEAQRHRAALQRSASTPEDVFWSLQQEVHICPVRPATIGRVSQLTRKTNQFNVTTRRYAEQDIAERASRPGWHVLTVRVVDRFGDNGLVGVAMTVDTGGVCHIDTFLLSCRVIARTIDTALLAYIVNAARLRHLDQVQGWFRPSGRNAPAQDFYARHSFERLHQDGEHVLWGLSLAKGDVPCPPWIRLTAEAAVL